MRLSSLLISTASSALALAAASAAHAGLVPVAWYTSGSTQVAYDRTLLTPTSRGTETATSFALGESALNTNDTRGYIPFALSAQDQADILTPGATVTLFVNLGVASNAAGSTFSLVGLTDRGPATVGGNASPGIVGTVADYSTASSELIQGGIVAAQQQYVFDVTNFVKAQAAANTAIAFRLQGDNVANASDSLQNTLTFSSGDNATAANRPTLTVTVPEPAGAGAALLVGAAAATSRVRRRRAL